MKRVFIITIALFGVSGVFDVKAQNNGVENSFWGVQTGLLGVWAHSETRLTNKLAFRTEAGIDAGFWYTKSTWFGENSGYALIPVLTLEPRLYYNILKRQTKGKSIVHNSANYLSLKTSVHPSFGIVSDKSEVNGDLLILPSWGIRRSIGRHFNYELGLGAGYDYIFPKNGVRDHGEFVIGLNLRIGYSHKIR
ncbi:MAG: hypothetical protein LBS80_06775 [Tannerella sp.]|jgi:hypothetical protein|nr:hypothetical protein [Tannerella sp.]